MDAAEQNALTAVSLSGSDVQQWFDLLCQTYTGLDHPDWDTFSSALTQNASGAGLDSGLVDQFTRAMTDNDSAPIDTIGKLVNYGTNRLSSLYQQASGAGQAGVAGGAGQAAASAGQQAGGYDEAAWYQFLAENGARWNGDESAWQQFKEWFLYQAGAASLTEPATGFISYVESQSDKVAAFAQYGIQITATAAAVNAGAGQGASAAAQAPDVSSYPELNVGDTGDWVHYLDQMLTSNGF